MPAAAIPDPYCYQVSPGHPLILEWPQLPGGTQAEAQYIVHDDTTGETWAIPWGAATHGNGMHGLDGTGSFTGITASKQPGLTVWLKLTSAISTDQFSLLYAGAWPDAAKDIVTGFQVSRQGGPVLWRQPAGRSNHHFFTFFRLDPTTIQFDRIGEKPADLP